MTARALGVEECLRRMESNETHIGRVAFDDGSGPIVLPINYRLHEGAVVFRTHGGILFDAAMDRELAAFETDWVTPLWREGWSVVVRGHLRVVDHPGTCEVLDTMLHSWDDSTDKSLFVTIVSTSITGRELT